MGRENSRGKTTTSRRSAIFLETRIRNSVIFRRMRNMCFIAIKHSRYTILVRMRAPSVNINKNVHWPRCVKEIFTSEFPFSTAQINLTWITIFNCLTSIVKCDTVDGVPAISNGLPLHFTSRRKSRFTRNAIVWYKFVQREKKRHYIVKFLSLHRILLRHSNATMFLNNMKKMMEILTHDERGEDTKVWCTLLILFMYFVVEKCAQNLRNSR